MPRPKAEMPRIEAETSYRCEICFVLTRLRLLNSEFKSICKNNLPPVHIIVSCRVSPSVLSIY